VALMPELRHTHHLNGHEIDGINIAEALELAIDDVCRRMRPLSVEEKQDPANQDYWLPPLTDDLALAVGGRIAAVVFASPDGPEVVRFGAFGGIEAL
jgi:hypothetical protein